MIRICERCYTPVEEGEEFYSLAHIDRALPDGEILWVHSHLHAGSCPGALVGRSPLDRPDTGEWDQQRRSLSPAAASWAAAQAAHRATRADIAPHR